MTVPGAGQDDAGFKEGDAVQGTVKGVNDFGIFLDVGAVEDAFLSWREVDGCEPAEGEKLHLVVTKIDINGRAWLGLPGSKHPKLKAAAPMRPRAPGGTNTEEELLGGYVYDVKFGVRPRRKGGKGDGKGSYTYREGLQFSDLLPEDDVSGHVTNIEPEGCWIDIGATKDAYLRWGNAPSISARWRVGDFQDDLKILRVEGEAIEVKWDDEGIEKLSTEDWEKLFTCSPAPKPLEEDPGPRIGDNCCALYDSTSATTTTKELKQPALLHTPDPAAVQGPSASSTPPSRWATTHSPSEAHDGMEDGMASTHRGTGKSGRQGYPWSASGDGRKGKGRGASAGRQGSESVRNGKSQGRGLDSGAGGSGKATGRGSPTGKGPPRQEALGSFWSQLRAKGGGAKGWGRGQGPAYANADEHGSCTQPAQARARSAPPPARLQPRPIEDFSIGDVVRGRVTSLSRTGVLVDFGCEVEGLIPRTLVTLRCKKGQVIPKLNIMGINTALNKITLEPVEDE